jgi:putative DNA primase/helicase
MKDANRPTYSVRTTLEIMDEIRNGTAKWLMPWTPGMGEGPFNPTTGNPYRGINSVVLDSAGYSDPRWMTYKQAQDIGCQVKRKPESTRTIEFWISEEEVLNEETGKKETVKLDKRKPIWSLVFNGEEILGLPSYKPLEPTWEPNARADDLIQASGAIIEQRNGNSAFYSHGSDRIVVPTMGQFAEMEHFYATVLHELGHWTGHPDRCNREFTKAGFGTPDYAREELTAELTSHFLCRNLALSRPGLDEQHAAYLRHWLTILESDPREIFRAAHKADVASSFLMKFDRSQVQQAQKEARKIEPVERVAEPKQEPRCSRTREPVAAGAAR